MFESKRSRGLALSAVSALTITGLTFTPTPSLAAPAGAVAMLSQLDGKASVRPDGRDTDAQYVQLVAERRDPTATISFEVNTDPAAGDDSSGWTPVDVSVAMVGRFATASWDALALVGTTVSLRAVATTDDETTYSTVNAVAVTGLPEGEDVAPHSASITSTTGGYFRQPYAGSERTATQLVVNGSSSSPEGTVALSWWRSSDGTFQGETDAVLVPGTYKVAGGDFPIGRFHEALDITGYDAEADGDVLAIRAVRDSDEVTPVEVYEQMVERVSAEGPEEADSRYDLQVAVYATDQTGRAIVGAEVRRLSDESLAGYTDVDGLVMTTQDAGTAETYYVNTTDTDAYEEDIDRSTGELTTPEFVPEVDGVVPVLADGDHFDEDEYEVGDIALQVVDQDDVPIAAADEELTYSYFANGAPAPEPTTATTDEDGRVVVPFGPEGPDGEYSLFYTAPVSAGGGGGEIITFTSGDSTLTLTPASGTVTSGGQVTYTGNLALDGNPLAGRSIELEYVRGTEESPGTGADAGIVVDDALVLSTTVTTDDDGSFTVTVADPAEAGRPAETGGILTATAPGAQESDSAEITFAADPVDPGPVDPGPVDPGPVEPTQPATPAKVKLKLTGASKGRAADRLNVTGSKTAAGQRVRIFAKIGKWRWKAVSTARLDRAGRVNLKLKDRNGSGVISYRVQLIASDKVAASTSNVKRLR